MGWFDQVKPYLDAVQHVRVDATRTGNSTIYGGTARVSRGGSMPIVQSMYNVEWFRRQQALVEALLAAKPNGRPVKERLYWSLMLMGTITDGLFFFNINDIVWSSAIHGDPIFLQPPGTTLSYGGVGMPAVGVPENWEPVMLDLWRNLDSVQKQLDPDLNTDETGTAFFGQFPESKPPVDIEGMAAGTRAYFESFDPPPDSHRYQPAPWFRGPLIGNSYPEAAFLVSGGNSKNIYKAPWWDIAVAQEQARHMPWLKGPSPLWNAGMLNVNRNAKTDRRATHDFSWGSPLTSLDTVAELAAQNLDPLFQSYYRLQSFGYRYGKNWGEDVSPSGHHIPTMWELEMQAEWSYAHPDYAPGDYGTGRLIKHLTFQKAFDLYAYDAVGVWFANMDVLQGFDAAHTAAIDYCTAGYTQKDPRNTAYSIGVGFVAHSDWGDINSARKLDKWLGKLGPLIAAISWIVDMVQGNYAGAFYNLGQSIANMVQAAEDSSLELWEVFQELPNLFLRSQGEPDDQVAGSFAYFNTCCGGTGTVYTRWDASMTDCRRWVVGALNGTLVGSVTGGGLMLADEVPDVPPGAPLPPNVSTPQPRVGFLLASPPPSTEQKWAKVLGWGAAIAAVGAGGYTLLKDTPQAQRAARIVTQSKPAQAVRRTTAKAKPYTRKAKAAVSRTASRGKSAAQRAYRRVRA